ncbi:hypothetical protein PLICRDRAFT_91158 [Plicaturopsis crispa FD-325 SS-3]|nr:hypothetical protein PLICRDRAFT_91158 [Plicaturopsis crispa FD-325 SS-3]
MSGLRLSAAIRNQSCDLDYASGILWAHSAVPRRHSPRCPMNVRWAPCDIGPSEPRSHRGRRTHSCNPIIDGHTSPKQWHHSIDRRSVCCVPQTSRPFDSSHGQVKPIAQGIPQRQGLRPSVQSCRMIFLRERPSTSWRARLPIHWRDPWTEGDLGCS